MIKGYYCDINMPYREPSRSKVREDLMQPYDFVVRILITVLMTPERELNCSLSCILTAHYFCLIMIFFFLLKQRT